MLRFPSGGCAPKNKEFFIMADTKEMNPVIAAAIGAEPEEKDCVCWVKA